MLRLRQYKSSDAGEIVKWVSDERIFKLWGGERFGEFPINADIINSKYFDSNGDCAESDNFFPVTAFDDEGVCGHFIMRYTGGDNRSLRFGWVVVSDERRGKGYGKEMLALGLKYAFEIYKAERVTIGVFENNTPAYRCYLSVGFRENEDADEYFEEVMGERVRIAELEITLNEYLLKYKGDAENGI